MKRPIVIMAIALITGVLLKEYTPSLWLGALMVVLIGVSFFLILRACKNASPFLFASIPLLIAGFILHWANTERLYNSLEPWSGRSISLQGYVIDEPQVLEGRISFTVKASQIEDGDKVYKLKGDKIKVSVYDDSGSFRLAYGAEVSIEDKLKLPAGVRNIGGFDYRQYLAGRGISATMSTQPDSVKLLQGSKVFALKQFGYSIRKSILDSLYAGMPEKEASIVAGMLIGYTDDMDESLQEDFQRVGLTHILAVSGANIAFILLPLLWLLKKCGFNRRWSSAISFPVMLFYVFATGMEASVVRAAIMAGVMLLGMIIWRQTDGYCSLACSAMIILFGNTFMLFDPGFILSFAATLSLIMLYEPISNKLPKKMPKSIKDTLSGTLAAQIGVLPIIAQSFNTISIISLLSNLVIVPVTGILTLVGALIPIFWWLLAPVAKVLAIAATFLTDVILFVASKLSEIPWAQVWVVTPGLFLIIGYYCLLLYVRFGFIRLKKQTAQTVLAVLLVVYGGGLVLTTLPPHNLMIYMADVGQGDCSVIKTPDGKSILIDGGGNPMDEENSYIGDRIVVPLLYDLHIPTIDIMIASHGDADHISGLKSVLRTMPVKRLVIAEAEDEGMKVLIDLAQSKGIPVERMDTGDIIYEEKELTLTTVYPLEDESLLPSAATNSANERSLVVRLDYGTLSALFTGDMGFPVEKLILNSSLLDTEILDCDILKVPHHGSKYAISREFLNKVTPAVALIGVGENHYGHPSPEVEQRLSDANVKVYDTLENGGIMIKTYPDNPEELHVETVVSN